jgi:hypothetical protein
MEQALERFDPKLRTMGERLLDDGKTIVSEYPNAVATREALNDRCQTLLLNLARLADAEGTAVERFSRLWKTERDYRRHVEKRKAEETITHEGDYAIQTFKVIANAETMVLAIAKNEYVTGKLQIEDNGWIVLIGPEGQVATSYHYMADKESFIDRHQKAQDIIHYYPLNEDLRKLLKAVFDRP